MSLNAMDWIENTLGVDVTGAWGQVIYLNVGGMTYTCLRKSFLKYQTNPVFKSLLNGNARKAEDGSLVIDRDGTTFRHVLNFLRLQILVLPDNFDDWDLLLDDARYYQLKELEDLILRNFEYQKRQFKANLPQSVLLRWGADLVTISTDLPAIRCETGKIFFEEKHVDNVDEAVLVLLSKYCFRLEHWRTSAEGVHSIFFILQ